ncbi:MAG: hypothetical protein ACTSRG_03895 [Candidatus Helarchaeota archaeon]
MQEQRKKRHYKITYKGSYLKKAREHREDTLREIVVELFTHYNFRKIDWRTLPHYHTHKYEPDVFFENDNCILIIELKAYHKNTICAEREAAQILKYATALKSVKEKFEKYPLKRFMLITSGTLIPLKNLRLDFEKDKHFIEKRYCELIEQIGMPKKQDDYDRRSTYKKLAKRIEKGNDIFPSDLMKYLPVECQEITNESELQHFLTGKKEFLTGFISAENFQDILSQLDNKNTKILFQLLRNIPLETLIKGKRISDYLF